MWSVFCSSPLSLESDFGGLDVGVLPFHLRTVHEVTQRVDGFRLPVDDGALLVHRRPVVVVLGVERLQVVHGSGHQLTWNAQNSEKNMDGR